MASDTCFVIMAIGDQQYVDASISSIDLKRRYDDLIKEAIISASPTLEIVRADEVALPGSITTDIITRIMHSTYVVADVTYPNPNVFYELGLRHACRTGTIIIRDRNGPRTPFDISQLRHIDYENTPSGLKELSKNFARLFEYHKKDVNRPDNQFQEIAQLTQYKFPDYSPPDTSYEIDFFKMILTSPKLMDTIIRQGRGENPDPIEILSLLSENPDIAEVLLKAMKASGKLSIFPNKLP